MADIEVSIEIARPRERVWREVADLSSHAEWMADAESIRFLSPARQGAGTRMEVATRVGPFRTRDVIEVLDWVEGERIEVRHAGPVTGFGAFHLASLREDLTRFTWRERLSFPWYLGGPLAAAAAAPVLTAIWRGNLRRLKERIER